MKDTVYMRFTDQDPRGHASQDSMTGAEVEGVYCYRIDLPNPYLSDKDILDYVTPIAKTLASNDVHAWGYSNAAYGSFVVFEGEGRGNGRDGQIASVGRIVGWGNI